MNAPRLQWPSKLLLACATLLVLGVWFYLDFLQSALRYHVVERDAVTGDVIVFDAIDGRVVRVRTPTTSVERVER